MSLLDAYACSADAYRSCLARAKRAIENHKFPTTTLHLIEQDIKATLPSLHLFTPGTGPLYAELEDMLCAWFVSRSDEGLGYVMGASKVAAMFLLNMSAQSAFIAMRSLLERHCLRSFYGGLEAKQEVCILTVLKSHLLNFESPCRSKLTIGTNVIPISYMST